METSGLYADTQSLRDLLNRFSDERLAALWDMYSTFVTAGEDPERTITNLGAYVRHVHIHDFTKKDGEPVPELIGDGLLPLKELMNALRSINYDGFISLEWDPDWMPEIADMEIIFTHFVNVMGRFQNTRLNSPTRSRSNIRRSITPAPIRSFGMMWTNSREYWFLSASVQAPR